jgi:SAM-dependent methyltransferase
LPSFQANGFSFVALKSQQRKVVALHNEESSDGLVGAENSAFWDELCGSNAAIQLGIDAQDLTSLRKFDDWYFRFYPYLIPFVKRNLEGSTSCLEVGLGYGSLGQFLSTEMKIYTGMDISRNATEMMRFRLDGMGHPDTVVHSDVLNCPFEDDSFDSAVAIGSLHHTGDFDRAISELARVVRNNGRIVGMVYSYFSLRNWMLYPTKSFLLALRNLRVPIRVQADERLRWLSDHNSQGEAAPTTEYFSRRALRKVLSEYGQVKIRSKNFDSLPIPFGLGELCRQILIRSPLGFFLGLDLYFVVSRRNEIN